MEESVGKASRIFEMVVETRPHELVVGLAGELDVSCSDALAELISVDLAGLDRDVVFDLARLDFIDLAGARLLGEAARLVIGSGWQCSVASPVPLAAWVIEFAGFAHLLPGRCRRQSMVDGGEAVPSDGRAGGEDCRQWRINQAPPTVELLSVEAVGDGPTFLRRTTRGRLGISLTCLPSARWSVRR